MLLTRLKIKNQVTKMEIPNRPNLNLLLLIVTLILYIFVRFVKSKDEATHTHEPHYRTSLLITQ